MSSHPPDRLTAAALEFLAVRHLATLTTLRPDGSPHSTPVGFTWDHLNGTARVITSRTSRKVAHVRATGRVALCQIDGRTWLTLEGRAVVRDEPERVADAVARYAQRYRVPRVNPLRVAIEISVTRVLGSAHLVDRS